MWNLREWLQCWIKPVNCREGFVCLLLCVNEFFVWACMLSCFAGYESARAQWTKLKRKVETFSKSTFLTGRVYKKSKLTLLYVTNSLLEFNQHLLDNQVAFYFSMKRCPRKCVLRILCICTFFLFNTHVASTELLHSASKRSAIPVFTYY